MYLYICIYIYTYIHTIHIDECLYIYIYIYFSLISATPQPSRPHIPDLPNAPQAATAQEFTTNPSEASALAIAMDGQGAIVMGDPNLWLLYSPECSSPTL